MKGSPAVVTFHKDEHWGEVDRGQRWIGKVFRVDRGGRREKDKQAKIGTRSPGAPQRLLKLVCEGRNLFNRRKESHDANAKPFRRRGGRIVSWHKCFFSIDFGHSPRFWLKDPHIWCFGDCVKDEDRGVQRMYQLVDLWSPAIMLRISESASHAHD